MSSTVLYMSMSLDGFIAGPNEGPHNPLGDGGHRLHEWALSTDADQTGNRGQALDRLSGVDREVFDEMLSTGAVLAGRGYLRTRGWMERRHHDGVPIFILSRHEPSPEFARWPAVTYVTDLKSAVGQAKQAAGEKNVLVHGASIAQWALAAGLLDELQIHLVPLLFGEGRRLVEHLGSKNWSRSEWYRVATPRTCAIASDADFRDPGSACSDEPAPPFQHPVLGRPR
jgi:dihydrofolate reductase